MCSLLRTYRLLRSYSLHTRELLANIILDLIIEFIMITATRPDKINFNFILDLIDSSISHTHTIPNSSRVKSSDAIWIDFATFRKTYGFFWFDLGSWPAGMRFFTEKVSSWRKINISSCEKYDVSVVWKQRWQKKKIRRKKILHSDSELLLSISRVFSFRFSFGMRDENCVLFIFSRHKL